MTAMNCKQKTGTLFEIKWGVITQSMVNCSGRCKLVLPERRYAKNDHLLHYILKVKNT